LGPPRIVTPGLEEKAVPQRALPITGALVGCVAVVAAVAMFMLFSRHTRSCRATTRKVFRTIDVVFSDFHYQKPSTVLIDFPTSMGGVLTIALFIAAASIAVYVSLKTLSDPPRIQTWDLPSINDFKPSHDTHVFSLEIDAMGVDADPSLCQAICRRDGTLVIAHGASWTLTCPPRPTGRCSVIAVPDIHPTDVPPSLALTLHLPQTRVFAWHWRLHTASRSGYTEPARAAASAIAPENRVLCGEEPSVAWLGLDRVRFLPLNGPAESGFAPFVLKAIGGAVSAITPQDTSVEYGATLRVQVAVTEGIKVYAEVSRIDVIASLSLGVGLLAILFRLVKGAKFLLEWAVPENIQASRLDSQQQALQHKDLCIALPEIATSRRPSMSEAAAPDADTTLIHAADTAWGQTQEQVYEQTSDGPWGVIVC